MGLSQDTGVYQKAESKSKISNVKKIVYYFKFYAASCLVTDRRFIFHNGLSIGGIAQLECLKFFLERGLISKL